MYIPSEVMGEYLYWPEDRPGGDETRKTVVRGNSSNRLKRDLSTASLQRSDSSTNLKRENSRKDFMKSDSSRQLLTRGNSSSQLHRDNSSVRIPRQHSHNKLETKGSYGHFERANSSCQLKRGDSSRTFVRGNSSGHLQRANSSGQLKRGDSSNSSKKLVRGDSSVTKQHLSRQQTINNLHRGLSSHQITRQSSSTGLNRGDSSVELPNTQMDRRTLNRAVSRGEIVREVVTSGCALHDHKTQDIRGLQPHISSGDLNARLQRSKSWLSGENDEATPSIINKRLLKGPGKEFLARDSFTNLYNSEYSLQTDPVSSLYTRYR